MIDTEVVDPHHVCVRESGRGPSLLPEPRLDVPGSAATERRAGQVLPDHLHGDLSLQDVVGGLVHGAHAAPAAPPLESVSTVQHP